MSDAFKDSIQQMKTLDLQILQSFYGELSDEEIAEILNYFYLEAQQYQQLLTEAIASQNALEVVRVAHKLKSMAAITGAEQFATLCVWLERIMRAGDLAEMQELSVYLSPLWQELERSIHARIYPEGRT